MKVVSALVVVFALLIALGPSPGAAKIKCAKQDTCISKPDGSFTKSNPETAELKDCDECVAWGCLKDGIAYLGVGCRGDENVCKDGKNQDGEEQSDATHRFVSCKKDNCALAKWKTFNANLDKMPITYDGECTPNKDGTKIGALTIGGMILLAWMFGRY